MHLVFKRLPFAFTFAYTPKATCLPRPYKPSYCPSFPDTHMLHRVLPCPQVLGAKRKTLAGFSSTTTQPHQGFIHGCAIMHTTPPSLRGKAARLIAAKSTLLARKDAYGEDPAVRGAGGHEEEGQGGGGRTSLGVVGAGEMIDGTCRHHIFKPSKTKPCHCRYHMLRTWCGAWCGRGYGMGREEP